MATQKDTADELLCFTWGYQADMFIDLGCVESTTRGLWVSILDPGLCRELQRPFAYYGVLEVGWKGKVFPLCSGSRPIPTTLTYVMQCGSHRCPAKHTRSSIQEEPIVSRNSVHVAQLKAGNDLWHALWRPQQHCMKSGVSTIDDSLCQHL